MTFDELKNIKWKNITIEQIHFLLLNSYKTLISFPKYIDICIRLLVGTDKEYILPYDSYFDMMNSNEFFRIDIKYLQEYEILTEKNSIEELIDKIKLTRDEDYIVKEKNNYLFTEQAFKIMLSSENHKISEQFELYEIILEKYLVYYDEYIQREKVEVSKTTEEIVEEIRTNLTN